MKQKGMSKFRNQGFVKMRYVILLVTLVVGCSTYTTNTAPTHQLQIENGFGAPVLVYAGSLRVARLEMLESRIVVIPVGILDRGQLRVCAGSRCRIADGRFERDRTMHVLKILGTLGSHLVY